MKPARDWISTKLANCVDVLDHLRIPVNEEERSQRQGTTPYYGANGIQGTIEGWLFDEPLVLMAEDGGYFDEFETRPVAYKISGKSWVNNHAHILRPKAEFDFNFIFYSLEHKDVMPFIKGGTRAKLNQKELREIEIFLPKRKVIQNKISNILLSIDNSIGKTESLIHKYQQIKVGLIHDLFNRGVTADGNLRPPRKQTPELYKETPVGWIPKEWDVDNIGSLFHIQLGKMLSRAAKTGRWTASYLGNKNVQWDKVDLSNLEQMDFNPAEREKFKLIKGDLLVCEGGDVGRTSMWEGEMADCYYQKAIHRLRPKDGRMIPLLMLRIMRYAKDTGAFTDFTSQTSIAHLTQEKLCKINVMIPKVDEQILMIDRLNGIDQKINTEKAFLQKLVVQKSGLMHDLLTGKVEVKIDSQDFARV